MGRRDPAVKIVAAMDTPAIDRKLNTRRCGGNIKSPADVDCTGSSLFGFTKRAPISAATPSPKPPIFRAARSSRKPIRSAHDAARSSEVFRFPGPTS